MRSPSGFVGQVLYLMYSLVVFGWPTIYTSLTSQAMLHAMRLIQYGALDGRADFE